MQIFSHKSYVYTKSVAFLSLFHYNLRESANVMFCVIYNTLTTLKFVFFCNASAAHRVTSSDDSDLRVGMSVAGALLGDFRGVRSRKFICSILPLSSTSTPSVCFVWEASVFVVVLQSSWLFAGAY